MIDYITNNGISQHWNFFPQEKYQKIERDLKSLDYKASHQPATNTYGNRLQAYPCYEAEYNKHNSYIINKLSSIGFKKITLNTFSMPISPLGTWSFIKCKKAR